jgi:ribonuclease VapC
VIVVDTSALLAILNKEAERDRFLDVLASDDRVMVSAVTLYESMLVAAARRGPDNLSDLAQILETVQAEIVPFDADQARTRLSNALRQRHASNGAAQSVRLRRVRPGETPQRFPALQGHDFAATDISPA